MSEMSDRYCMKRVHVVSEEILRYLEEMEEISTWPGKLPFDLASLKPLKMLTREIIKISSPPEEVK